jgi:hypothetical protein
MIYLCVFYFHPCEVCYAAEHGQGTTHELFPVKLRQTLPEQLAPAVKCSQVALSPRLTIRLFAPVGVHTTPVGVRVFVDAIRNSCADL